MRGCKLVWKLFLLKRNEKKSRKQIKNIQEKKLRELLLYAYDNSKYYKKSFFRAGIDRKDIDKLPMSAFPTIDKAILMKNFDQIVTVEDLNQKVLRRFDEKSDVSNKKYLDKYYVVHSSGSTGKPCYFIYDKSAWSEILFGIIRAALWNMSMSEIVNLIIKKPRIVYAAATDGRYAGVMAASDSIEKLCGEQLFLDIKTPVNEWINKLKEFKPNIIIGYPSSIKILGKLVENNNIKMDVCRIISCGEPLKSNLREYIESVFSAEIINIYGASESLVMGVEPSAEEGMILFDDLNYIEIEDGSMYLTTLYNFTQPIIRYKLSDNLKIRHEDESSGYPFTIGDSISGRDEDVLIFNNKEKNKEFLHPLAIEGICIDGLIDYQFKQTSEISFEMIVQISKGYNKQKIRYQIRQKINGILKEKQLENIHYDIIFVKEILPDINTGKKKLIIK